MHAYFFLCRSLKLESEIVSAEDCAKICPLLRTDDIVGALYAANDLSACDPSDVCRALSSEAQSQGVDYAHIVELGSPLINICTCVLGKTYQCANLSGPIAKVLFCSTCLAVSLNTGSAYRVQSSYKTTIL